LRRSARIAAVTKLLVERPYQTITLTCLSEWLGAAKSTLSEDIAIIRETFAELGLGRVETIAGAAGGVRYVPLLTPEQMREIVNRVAEALADPERILPGGFLYMNDILGDTQLLAQIGEVFATRFADRSPGAVVTVETGGIPIAMATARALNVPLAIVRRSGRLGDGTVVTMNYVTGPGQQMETMALPRRAIRPGTRVLVVDDVMRAGGTARGLIDLMRELDAEVVGIGVLVETAVPEQKLVDDYTSLVVVESVSERPKEVVVRPSPWVAAEETKR